MEKDRKSFENFFQGQTIKYLEKNGVKSFEDFEKFFEENARKLFGHDIVRRLIGSKVKFKQKQVVDFLLLDFINFNLTNDKKKRLNYIGLYYIFDLVNITKKDVLKIVSQKTIEKFEKAGAIFKDLNCNYPEENLLSNYRRFFLKKEEVQRFLLKNILYLDEFSKIKEKEVLQIVGVKMILRLKKEGAVFLKCDEKVCCLYDELKIQAKYRKYLNLIGVYCLDDFKNFTKLEIERATSWRFMERLNKKNIEFKIDVSELSLLNYKNFYILPKVRRKLYTDGYFDIKDLERMNIDDAGKYFAKKMLKRLIDSGAKFGSNRSCFLYKELQIIKKFRVVLHKMDIYCKEDFKKYYKYEIYDKISRRTVDIWEEKGIVFKEGNRFDWREFGINITTVTKLNRLNVFAPQDIKTVEEEILLRSFDIATVKKILQIAI